jgi:hypothetical protein
MKWLGLLLLVSGCLKPTPNNGAITCAPGGGCPDDYYCEASSHSCWKNGEAPSGDLGVADDGGTDDLSSGRDVGAQCDNNGDCANHRCIDGYCCDQPCSGACVACNLPGSEGTCTSVSQGQAPHHGSCGLEAMTSCGKNSLCDGNGACQLWPNTTVCKDSTCDSNTNLFTPQSTCDGLGACKTPTPITCAPFLCKDAVACYLTCTQTSGQCSPPNSCTNTSCGPKPLGATCTAGTECGSTYCADGVCCDGPCSNQCEACKLGGNSGHCMPVTGAPVAPRTPCASDNSSCGGSCNGTLRTACTFPPSGQGCGAPASCSGNNTLSKSICDGAGFCKPTTVSCNANACNSSVSPAVCYKGACGFGGVCATGASCCPAMNNFCAFSCQSM